MAAARMKGESVGVVRYSRPGECSCAAAHRGADALGPGAVGWIGAKSVPNPGEPGRIQRKTAYCQLSGSRGLSSSGVCSVRSRDSLLIRMSIKEPHSSPLGWLTPRRHARLATNGYQPTRTQPHLAELPPDDLLGFSRPWRGLGLLRSVPSVTLNQRVQGSSP
jgi:hypothetical protein